MGTRAVTGGGRVGARCPCHSPQAFWASTDRYDVGRVWRDGTREEIWRWPTPALGWRLRGVVRGAKHSPSLMRGRGRVRSRFGHQAAAGMGECL